MQNAAEIVSDLTTYECAIKVSAYADRKLVLCLGYNQNVLPVAAVENGKDITAALECAALESLA